LRKAPCCRSRVGDERLSTIGTAQASEALENFTRAEEFAKMTIAARPERDLDEKALAALIKRQAGIEQLTQIVHLAAERLGYPVLAPALAAIMELGDDFAVQKDAVLGSHRKGRVTTQDDGFRAWAAAAMDLLIKSGGS
jgi:hypothetical protein